MSEVLGENQKRSILEVSIAKLQKQEDVLKGIIDKLGKDTQLAQAKRVKALEEAEASKLEIQAIEKKINEKRSEVEAKANSLKKEGYEIGLLRDKLNHDIERFKADNRAFRAEKSLLADRIKEYENTLVELEKKKEEAEKIEDEAYVLREIANKTNAEAEEKLKEAKEKIQSLEVESGHLNSRVAVIEKREKELDKAQADLSAMRQELTDEYNAKVENFEKEKSSLEEVLRKRELALAKAEEKIESHLKSLKIQKEDEIIKKRRGKKVS